MRWTHNLRLRIQIDGLNETGDRILGRQKDLDSRIVKGRYANGDIADKLIGD